MRDLPVELAASALLNGTTYAPLRRSLAFSEPNSITKLFDRVEQFIVQMEILDAGEVVEEERKPGSSCEGPYKI